MKKIALLIIILLALIAINIFARKLVDGPRHTDQGVTDFNLKVSFTLAKDASVPMHFADTLEKAQKLLNLVFSSREFKEMMFKQSYHDSAYSKSKKACFETIYDVKTGRISGESVYHNLLADKSVALLINIKNNGDKKTTMGSSNACSNNITTYDYWLVEGGALAQRLARHIAHEFTHVRGYRHDSKVAKAYKWGHDVKEDPAYSVGSIVGEILTKWAKKGLI